MPVNIQDVLAYEIKKEIADRYFGFRKLIEEDTLDLEEKARQHRFILEKRISFDLIRLYILLRDEKIIHNFLLLTGLQKELFYDPYLAESEPIKMRVFQGVKLRGFFWKSRYRNLILDIYERLAVHVAQYCEKSREIAELGENIQEEIKIFHRTNDLGNIIGFLRSLGDHSSHRGMQGGMESGIAEKLQNRMQIKPPVLENDPEAIIQQIPPLLSIKSQLKALINEAYGLHGGSFRLFFTKIMSTPSEVPR